MTTAELNKVRDLREKIRDLEWHLADLRKIAENLAPIQDGMPHAQSTNSKVEKLALRIVEIGKEISALQEEMDAAAAWLLNELKKFLHGQELRIMTLRYVACKHFRDIQFELDLSDSRVFYYHRQALKKLK